MRANAQLCCAKIRSFGLQQDLNHRSVRSIPLKSGYFHPERSLVFLAANLQT